ncbi:MAG: winged helix-turn-helix domain-containing tetratricopeptide repeat protein [Pyrinomonadaceae bacterium]
MYSAVRNFYEFGRYRFDAARRRLSRDGQPVPLPPKAAEVLSVLLRHHGRLVEREELMRAVWADSFVEDANLTVAVSQLRKAFGQNGAADYIETTPRLGYRFSPEVREVCEEPVPLVIEKITRARTVIEEEFIQDETEPAARVMTRGRAPLAKRLAGGSTRRRAAGVLAAAALLAAVAGSASYFKNTGRRAGGAATPARAPVKSIAILPPKTSDADAESASLGLGIADVLSTRLGRLRKLVVRAPSAINRYPGGYQDPLEAGRELGVDAVLEGSLQRERGKIRLTLRLLEVSDAAQLWAGSFERDDADIFELEDSASEQVVEALSLSPSGGERAFRGRRPTQNPEAYALYLQGNYFWNKRGGEVKKSLAYFRRAIELDPGFALPYVGLAKAYATQAGPAAEAQMLVEKALQLDDDLAEAHATYGFIRMFHHWDWAGAGRAFDRAIELDPNSVTAHHWRGVYLSLLGRLDEAEAEMRRALELDPLSTIVLADLGQLRYFAHDYDGAAAYCEKALALDGESQVAHEYLRDIYVMKGMEREALNKWLQAGTHVLGAGASQRTGGTFAGSGFRGFVRKDLESLLNATDSERAMSAPYISRHYMYVGDKEQALRWLSRAYKEHAFILPFINVDPLYDPLRDNPEFRGIIHGMRL